jgi:hypothetical protein
MKKIMFNDKYGLTQAVLDGRKTQTRRIAYMPNGFITFDDEDFQLKKLDNGHVLLMLCNNEFKTAHYKIGEEVAIAQRYSDIADTLGQKLWQLPCWRNKMFVKADFMPHRIRITNIRDERLQDISEEDCMAEGIWRDDNVGLEGTTYWYHGLVNSSFRTAKEAYAALIDKISGKGTWESNPWVFVYNFKLVK